MRRWSLKVSAELRLALAHLPADVEISGGAPPDTATIEVDGDERLLALIELASHQSLGIGLSYGMHPPELIVKRTGDHLVFSGRSCGSRASEPSETLQIEHLPRVLIRLPTRTILDVRAGVAGGLKIEGVNDCLLLTASGKRKVEVRGALNPEVRLRDLVQAAIQASGHAVIDCSGLSRCEAQIACGHEGRPTDLQAKASDQSSIGLTGTFDDVRLQTRGLSHVTLNGPCAKILAIASNASQIVAHNTKARHIRRECSGIARIIVT